MIYKDRGRRIWLTLKLALDALIALSSFYLAFALRFGFSPLRPAEVLQSDIFRPYMHVLLLAPAIRIGCSFMAGLYEPKKGMKKVDALFVVFKAATLGSLVMVVLLFSYRGFFEFREFSYSRLVVLIDLGINLALLTGSRIGIAYADSWLRGSGIGLKNALFVGYNDEVGRIIGEMSRDVSLGCRVVGYVGEEAKGAQAPYLGGKDALVPALQERSVDEVYVLDSYVTQQELLELSAWCERLDTDIRIIPSLYMVMTTKAVVDEIAGIPTILVKKGGIRGWRKMLKEG
ncbi:MAG TPA: hypothetical protein VJM83_00980, partial [Nitrospirota bacterium]|nr:hypothetical protein [Nitrospirota bacterium]